MLKYIKVPIIIDDHEPEKCGAGCQYWDSYNWICNLYNVGDDKEKPLTCEARGRVKLLP